MKLLTVHSLVNDAWTLFKSFAERTLSEDEKEIFVNECGELMKKYHDDPLAIDILSAVYREIDRQVRKWERKVERNDTGD